ncbi:MAG: OmpA family protein, partial [Pseudomonadota bacterium]
PRRNPLNGRHALTASALTLCSILFSGPVPADSATPPDCQSFETNQSVDTDTSEEALAERLACYNSELDGLSLLIGDLLKEREKISTLLNGSAAIQIEQDGAGQHLETIEALRLERSKLSAQLHQQLIEKQERLLDKEAEERLLRNYSQAYLAIADENSELVTRVQTLNQRVEALEQQQGELSEINQQLTTDNTTYKATIADLSAHKTKLTSEIDSKQSLVKKLRTQLLETANLSEQLSAKVASGQNDIATLQQSNSIAQFNIEKLNEAAAGYAASREAERKQAAQHFDELQNQLSQLQSEYESLGTSAQQAATAAADQQAAQSTEIAALNSELETLRNTRDALEAQLQAADQLLSEQKDALIQATGSNAEQQQTIESLNAQIALLDEQITEQQQTIDTAATAAQAKATEAADTELVLEQTRQQLNDANEALASSKKRIDELDALNASMTADLNETADNTQTLQSSLDTKTAEVANLSQARDTVLNASDALLDTNEDLRRRLSARDAELASADDTSKTQLDTIASLTQQRDDATADAMSKQSKIDALALLLDKSQSNNEVFAQSLESIKSELHASNARLNDQQTQLQSLVTEKEAIVETLNQAKTDTDKLAKTIADELAGELENNADAVTVDVMPDNTIGLNIASSQLFRVGSSRLSQDGRTLLKQVGAVVAGNSNRRILIEGHSDNLPLGAKLEQRFKDNMGLSLARARSAADFLTADAAIPLPQLSITGAGDSRPVAPNDSEEGRQQNRRVEILLLPLEFSSAPQADAKEAEG